MKKINTKKKGFTIVELVIVIAVIGILAAILIPTFINLNNKAKVSNTQSFLKNVNTQLAAKEANPDVDNYEFDEEGRKTIKVMNDGIKYADDVMGFNIRKISPFDGNEIVWDMENHRFALIKDRDFTSPVYAEAGLKEENAQYLHSTQAEAQADLAAGKAVYLNPEFETDDGSLTIKGPVDCGENTNIKVLNYVSDSSESVDINTNGGTLNINAPSGKVHHYGNVDSVNITAIDDESYYENGNVGYANIQNGRLVVEETAKIEGIYLVDTEGEFNNIKLAVVGEAKLPSIARANVEDEMEDNTSKLVVEIQTLTDSKAKDENPEYVWISKSGSEVTSAVSSSKEESDFADNIIDNPSKAAQVTKEETKESATQITDDSVARINAVGYSTLESAFENAKNGSNVLLLKNTSVDSIITIEEEMSLVLDLNGFTIENNVTGDQYVTYHTYSMWPTSYGTANAAGRAFVLLDGASLTVNANGGGMEIPDSNTNSYGFFRVYAATLVINEGSYTGNTNNGAFIHMKAYSCGDVTLKNVTAATNYRFLASDNQVYGKVNVIGGTYNQSNDGLSTPNGTIPAFWISMSRATFEDTSITSYWGECVCVNSSYYAGQDSEDNIESFFKGNNSFTVLTNNTIQSWNCCAIGIEAGAIVNVEDGIYNGYKYGTYIFTSNGRLNISGGTFTGSTAALRVDHNDNNYHPSTNPTMVPGIIVSGGTFNGPLIQGNDTEFIVSGGTFTADPTNFVDTDLYNVTGEGPYIVSSK